MRQAHRWLLLTAALVLFPQTALAQARKPRGGIPKKPATTAPAPASAATPSGAPTTGAQPGTAGPVEIELDTDTATPKPPTTDAPASAPSTAPESAGAAAGGICEIDPAACPKALDIQSTAQRPINAEVYAVQQIYALRRHRFEVQPYWSFSLNDQFVSHPGPGLALNYYVTNVLAVGVNGNFYAGLNGESDFNFQNRRAARVAVPLNEYQWGANLNFTYVPMYGKFAGFSKFIFHYDAYVVGGVGAISTRPIPVIDPDNRKFDFEPKVAFNAGIGLRIFFNRWFAANLEVRDYIYNEKLESLNIAANATDKATWFGNNQLTNNVQAQLGVSIFLPFSWEYRLPK